MIKKVLVIGAGTMGKGIAGFLASCDIQTFLLDQNVEITKLAIEQISQKIQKDVDAKVISEERKKEIMSKILPVPSLSQVGNVDIVIEAVVEDLEIKKNLFRDLDKIFPSNIILATNTSSLSISEIGRCLKNQERIIGIHFFNPVSKMKLVEIIPGEKTSNTTIERAKNFVEQIGKFPVISRDSPGFIVNRILIPMINEAIFALYEGVADKQSIDDAMKLGAAHPMGPLALADLIGLDVCLDIMETLEKSFNDPKYRPCPLLYEMVKQNKLGRKTKEGFYLYK